MAKEEKVLQRVYSRRYYLKHREGVIKRVMSLYDKHKQDKAFIERRRVYARNYKRRLFEI